MSCHHAKAETSHYQYIGQEPELHRVVICKLKQRSTLARSEVYGKLFDLGFEGSIETTACPLAEAERWKECPFYKAA